MPRPPEPEKREALLERCFAAALEAGSLGLTLDALARHAGTSARMLLYHFGSKQALDAALVARFEGRLRERFAALAAAAAGPANAAPAGAGGLADVALALWDELTAPSTRSLLHLTEDLRRRALAGDADAARALAAERAAWERLLADAGLAGDVALAVLLLADGAAADVLLTGDPGRGRRAFAVLLGPPRPGARTPGKRPGGRSR